MENEPAKRSSKLAKDAICYEKCRLYEILYKEMLQKAMDFKILNVKPAGIKVRPVLLQNIPRENCAQGTDLSGS